jgi:hypothetical protein
MGVQALEASRTRMCTAHAKVQLRSELPLLGMRSLEARRQPGILGGSAGPALHAAGRFEPRHRCHELWAREPEGRRERVAVLVERVLLRDRGMPERAADDNAPKGPRRPA